MEMVVIGFPVAAYLIGSVPSGLIIGRWLSNTDVRTIGSGNIGATNVKRAAGLKAALLVLACDVLKGLLPILLAQALLDSNPQWPWLSVAMALAAVLGHMYPVYLGFKPSGKGVATTCGCYLWLAPWACLAAATVFIALAVATRRMSVASLAGSAILTPAVWLTTQDAWLTGGAIMAVLLIVLRHKDNIGRLRQGIEPRF